MNRLAMMFLKNIHRVPGLLGKLNHYAKHTDEYPEQEKWDHISRIMDYAIKAGNVDLQVTGLENLPQEGPFMLYANHQGMFDVVAIAATCKLPLGCVLKKELENVPMLKQIIVCTKSFPMDRSDTRQSLTVIQSVIAELKKGRRYLIFPEGTRSRKGNEMNPFHHGSFRCAVKTKCPVVPLAFVDSFKVLDDKGSKTVTVHMQYLEPIYYEQYQGMTTVELAAMVQERIRVAMESVMQ